MLKIQAIAPGSAQDTVSLLSASTLQFLNDQEEVIGFVNHERIQFKQVVANVLGLIPGTPNNPVNAYGVWLDEGTGELRANVPDGSGQKTVRVLTEDV